MMLMSLEFANSSFLLYPAKTDPSTLQPAAGVQGQLDQSNPGKLYQT